MIKNKRVIAVTLARGGSKRVPGKNKALICGKPLIQYTIDEVKKSKYIDEYVIASDDIDIIKIANENKCSSYKRLSVPDTQTSSSGITTCLIAMYSLEHLRTMHDTIIVEVMCTNPLKTVDDIDGTIEKLFEGDSAVSVSQIWDNHPSRVKYIGDNELKDFYPEIPESRRQDLTPNAYVRNGSVYAMWWKDLESNETRLSGKVIPYIMPASRTLNIDEPNDLELAKINVANILEKSKKIKYIVV